MNENLFPKELKFNDAVKAEAADYVDKNPDEGKLPPLVRLQGFLLEACVAAHLTKANIDHKWFHEKVDQTELHRDFHINGKDYDVKSGNSTSITFSAHLVYYLETSGALLDFPCYKYLEGDQKFILIGIINSETLIKKDGNNFKHLRLSNDGINYYMFMNSISKL